MLQSSRIIQNLEALIVKYSQKKEYMISFVFYCFENLSIAITLEPLVQFRWGFQLNVPLLLRTNQTENWKCHIFDFRLIPLDRITYLVCYVFDTTSVKNTPNLKFVADDQLCKMLKSHYVNLLWFSIRMAQCINMYVAKDTCTCTRLCE